MTALASGDLEWLLMFDILLTWKIGPKNLPEQCCFAVKGFHELSR